jgi:hypothetical protein
MSDDTRRRVHRKLTPPAKEIVKNSTASLGPFRNITEGDEVSVYLPGRKTATRVKFKYADDHGNLTVVDPRNNGLRTVTPDAVKTIHRKKKGTR